MHMTVNEIPIKAKHSTADISSKETGYNSNTSLNAQGVYITAMPFNLILVESVAQTAGKVTTFVKGRYDAFVGGGISFGRYTETYALEDLNLYTAKQFAYGKAHDEKTAAVWTLQLPQA